jgi:hypothetical protein
MNDNILYSPDWVLPGWSAEDLKQMRFTDSEFSGSPRNTDVDEQPVKRNMSSSLLDDMDFNAIKNEPLWSVLQDTARRIPLYPNFLAYVNEKILPNNPNITARELASKMSISYGEALVLLSDLKDKK